MSKFSIIDVMNDPSLLRPSFEGPSWTAWRAVIKAAFALRMTPKEIEIFRSLSGDRDPPKARVKEFWVIFGRRAGKDSVASLIATYAAAFCNYTSKLRPGEKALTLCLARDRDQSRIVLGYTKAYFAEVPLLKGLVTRETQNGFELENGSEVAIVTNDFRAVRGRSIAVAIFDECSFWPDELSVAPDKETYRAVMPGLRTLDGMLIGISTPYRKSGLLYEKFKKHYGKNDDNVLVIKGPSTALNPTLDQAMIEADLADDPESARAEWLGEFRDDISGYVDREVIESLVVPGRHELPPANGVRYFAFCDPSGGMSDSMTLAIAHRSPDGRAVLDVIRESKPPFSPEAVVREYSELLKDYRNTKVVGDHWGGMWPQEQFSKHGITYEVSERTKSDIYLNALPLLNSAKVELLSGARLIAQLVGLERRTARGGRESIDHSPGSHDDLANAALGALLLCSGKRGIVGQITPEMIAAMSNPRDPDVAAYRSSHGQTYRDARMLADAFEDSYSDDPHQHGVFIIPRGKGTYT